MAPAAQWLATPDTTDRRIRSRSAAGHDTCTHTASRTGALIPVVAGAAQPQAFMSATARPALVRGWSSPGPGTRAAVLDRKAPGDGPAAEPMRPPTWADSTDDQCSGLRATEIRWVSIAAVEGTPSQLLKRRPQGEPDPSSYAAWMSPLPEKQLPRRDRLQLQPAARISRGSPYPTQLMRVLPLQDHRHLGTRLEVIAYFPPGPWPARGSMENGDSFTGSNSSPLGQPSKERTRRLEAQTSFWRTTRGHGGQLPSSGPSGIACGWPPSTSSGQPTSARGTAQFAGAVAARVLSICRKALLGDWRLATVTIRQTGVLSDWLRGRDPKLTWEEFREHWCHRDILCELGAAPKHATPGAAALMIFHLQYQACLGHK
ncbi:g7987 [Coccomyxa elongata]